MLYRCFSCHSYLCGFVIALNSELFTYISHNSLENRGLPMMNETETPDTEEAVLIENTKDVGTQAIEQTHFQFEDENQAPYEETQIQADDESETTAETQKTRTEMANEMETTTEKSRDMSRNARNGKFGNFDEISPKIKSNPANSARMAILAIFRQRAIELEIGVPTKRRFWRIRRIRREWRFWRNFAKERLSSR